MIYIFEYIEFIEDIFNRPFGILLIIAGLSFLLIAVLFKIGDIQNRVADITAVLMGIFLTVSGFAFHLNSATYLNFFSVKTETAVPDKETPSQKEIPKPPAKEQKITPVSKAVLSCTQVSQFEFIWNTKGSEIKEKASFYRPLPPAGYKIFGHYAQGDFHQPNGKITAVKVLSEPDKEGYLTYPLEYECIWRNTGSNGAIWRPIPPPGYVSLGDVATAAYLKPDRREVVCLKDSLASDGKRGDLLWGSNSDNNLSSVRVYPVFPEKPDAGIGLNMFQGYERSGFRKTGYISLPVLKNEYVIKP